MKYLQLYERFKNISDGELVTYKGDVGRVLSKKKDSYILKIFKLNKELEIDSNDPDLEKMKRCVGECDKKVTELGGERVIKCFGCDRILSK
jgi:argonaute-like protein implicated in RNA metabolism and viral defense